MKKVHLIVFICSIILFSMSCKKEKKTEQIPVNQTPTVTYNSSNYPQGSFTSTYVFLQQNGSDVCQYGGHIPITLTAISADSIKIIVPSEYFIQNTYIQPVSYTGGVMPTKTIRMSIRNFQQVQGFSISTPFTQNNKKCFSLYFSAMDGTYLRYFRAYYAQ